MDEWDKALARVKIYAGDVAGGTWDAAGGWAKSYYLHRRECCECEIEWRKAG
jgi:hypothetical protein